ncbi:D-alanine--D-alanine ligase [hydrothermal vent metagenome]|uniref:D-alanine--D-alanine ligase n=1 Tax=hydrothermal vent metagenome TaxID=652676 RepID=A0A1W1ELA0_9ZZZZ
MSVAVLFGGSSYEHEISIVSAITMKKVFKKTDLEFIFLDSDREFYSIDKSDMKSSFFSSGDYKKSKKLSLKSGGFYNKTFFGENLIEFDTLLNLIHGRDGEDGKVASLMEFYNIKYISPRIEASTLSYSKLYTKLLAKELGIEVVEYQHLFKHSPRLVNIKYPLIVKPARLGSSIGVSIVREKAHLDYALDIAFEVDDSVMIEPFIEGIKEYNLAGCKTTEWELSIIEEPQKDEFLDFDKKYMDFSRDIQVAQANIPIELIKKLQNSFKTIYEPLFYGSIIRCDFFVIDDKVILNEINPIPGSMANYLFEDFENMVLRLANSLPKEREIKVDYRYINSISQAKGKA